MAANDETAITEITIQPDGRVYVFGLSREVAEVLADICAKDHPLRQTISPRQNASVAEA